MVRLISVFMKINTFGIHACLRKSVLVVEQWKNLGKSRKFFHFYLEGKEVLKSGIP